MANPPKSQIFWKGSNQQRMAVTFHNPQDPEACSPRNVDDTIDPSQKNKHNRTLLYLRNKARGTATATNLSGLIIATILVVLSVHRVIALWATHRRWINAPITYMSRQCPAVAYETLDVTQSSSSSSSSRRRTNICITTLTDQQSPSKFQRFMRWRNFDGILALTWDNKARYAQKYGYYLYDASNHIDSSRPPAWSKIKAVQYLLELQQEYNPSIPKCDWVLWMDADTVIMNSSIAITDFLPADPTKDLLVGSDKGGGYNSGVFLFRNSVWSRQILDQWWNMRDFVRPPGLSLSGDNNALKALLANMNDFDQHVLSPPRCTFNSFAKFLTLGQSLRIMDVLEEQEWYMDSGHYHKGDFIAHTPGVDNKAECLKLLLREAI